MRAYIARYVIVDGDGEITYTGTASITSEVMPINHPDPIIVGACHARAAQTIRADCDNKPGVPAGQVVILKLVEAG